MSDAVTRDPRALLELSPGERAERGIGDEAVRDALVRVVESGTREAKRLEGCTLPALDLDFRHLAGENNHPLVFRDCAFEGPISAEGADVTVEVRFEDCLLDGLDLDHARFERDVVLDECEVTGPVDCFETDFEDGLQASGTTFAAPVSMDEATFGDDTTFEGADFVAETTFRAAAFAGRSNDLGDNADFQRATFAAGADFQRATFEAATFAGATVPGEAHFERVAFEGEADFSGIAFADETRFREARFGDDADFEAVTFEAGASFRGAVFEGGARSLAADACFVDVAAEADLNFRDADFRGGVFSGIEVESQALFERVRFGGNADFSGAAFDGEADFDEARFVGDADFGEATFATDAVFRGAEFEGSDNHHAADAAFEAVRFEGPVDFDDARFQSATFARAELADYADFTGATFERAAFVVRPLTNEAYVDCSNAVLRDGEIRQPTGGWVRYDLTDASVGSVDLDAEDDSDRRHLLDYIRFCNTEFNEFDGYDFDFSAHTDYLDRNDWALHTFDENFADVGREAELTPETIERTYLKAKTAASNAGQMKAAGEFRVKRQQYARKKYLSIAADASADVETRLKNFSRAVENAFLGVTCGHGMRLGRIAAVFLLAPMLPALLYAFGGPAFATSMDAGQLDSVAALLTAEGRSVFYRHAYFSYISFLTIGYGGITPQGTMARLLAGLEVYASVVLSGLVLYGLIKRSEI